MPTRSRRSLRPLILVSNDDGVHAPGIQALAEAMRPLGDVITVAPASEQSATSHAMTLARPLRLRRFESDRIAVDGTPVDSVYIALHLPGLLPRRPDIVVSGINHGLNLGTDVFYSGTVAAAREGALRGVPAIAFSLARHGDFPHAGAIARSLVSAVLAERAGKSGEPLLLNVNIPAGRIRGIRATRLGPRLYDEIVEMRNDPRGQQYLWIGGPNVHHPPSQGTDTAAFDAGYVSVTPLGLELWRADQMNATERFVLGLDLPRAAAGSSRTRAGSGTKRAPARARRRP
jgi:5'-nucleotidase